MIRMAKTPVADIRGSLPALTFGYREKDFLCHVL